MIVSLHKQVCLQKIHTQMTTLLVIVNLVVYNLFVQKFEFQTAFPDSCLGGSPATLHPNSRGKPKPKYYAEDAHVDSQKEK